MHRMTVLSLLLPCCFFVTKFRSPDASLLKPSKCESDLALWKRNHCELYILSSYHSYVLYHLPLKQDPFPIWGGGRFPAGKEKQRNETQKVGKEKAGFLEIYTWKYIGRKQKKSPFQSCTMTNPQHFFFLPSLILPSHKLWGECADPQHDPFLVCPPLFPPPFLHNHMLKNSPGCKSQLYTNKLSPLLSIPHLILSAPPFWSPLCIFQLRTSG